MSEECSTKSDLERLLDNSEDYKLTVHNYQAIQNALDSEDNIKKEIVEKLVALCQRELNGDLKFAANVVNILLTILKKLKSVKFPLPDLEPSMVTLMHILKSTASLNKLESLKALSFETLLSYPDETFISLVENDSNELLELIILYSNQRTSSELMIQVTLVISKILKILPSDSRTSFVVEGLSVWFTKLIPLINISSILPHVLNTLEILIDDICSTDYSTTKYWNNTMECICNPQRYPALMISLLKSKNDNWHRIWIICMKLLSRQIAQYDSICINPLLSVIEAAFRNQDANRCKAFKCWMVLIDAFSKEKRENYIKKKVNLIKIPFLTNNAKNDETIVAKLEAWWYFICSFYEHIDRLFEDILLPFLHFCFGKQTPDKVLAPGMLNHTTRLRSINVFIDLVGNNCKSLERKGILDESILSPKLLVNHWSVWIHCLRTVLNICSESEDYTNDQIIYLWKSFVIHLANFPEDITRRDLFNEVIGVLDQLTKNCNSRMADIIYVLIKELVTEDSIKPLMISKNEENVPIYKIIDIILKVPPSNLENKEIVDNLKPITNFIVEYAYKSSQKSIECIIKDLPPNGMLLWASLVESIICGEKSFTFSPEELCKILSWPFKYMEIFLNDKLATVSWLSLYKYNYNTLSKTTINEDIFMSLLDQNGSLRSFIFVLQAAITAVEISINGPMNNFEKEAGFLQQSITKIVQYKDIEALYSSLCKVGALMLNNLIKKKNEEVAMSILSIIVHMLKLLKQNDIVVDSSVEIFLESIATFLKTKLYSKLQYSLINELKVCSEIIKNQHLKDTILNILGAGNDNAELAEPIKTLQDNIKNTETVKNKPIDFSMPNKEPVSKKMRNESKIVKTVVEKESGEEFVVIKSNWKFNPKKLTVAQKEKFQQKKGDIPALYQDLSQSQDEFKLSTWKTDSQDTSISTKSTDGTGNEDVTNILKILPQSEFVPKILENIRILSADKEDTKIKKANMKKDSQDDSSKTQLAKTTKSPRMALKDRVSRNVRILIEKSDLVGENVKEINNDESPKTPPTNKGLLSSVSNSAPTIISADRPSRLKRTPQKFVDLKLYGLIKRRRSLAGNELKDTPKNSVSDIHTVNKPIKETTEKFADLKSCGLRKRRRSVGGNESYKTSDDSIPDIYIESKTITPEKLTVLKSCGLSKRRQSLGVNECDKRSEASIPEIYTQNLPRTGTPEKLSEIKSCGSNKKRYSRGDKESNKTSEDSIPVMNAENELKKGTPEEFSDLTLCCLSKRRHSPSNIETYMSKDSLSDQHIENEPKKVTPEEFTVLKSCGVSKTLSSLGGIENMETTEDSFPNIHSVNELKKIDDNTSKAEVHLQDIISQDKDQEIIDAPKEVSIKCISDNSEFVMTGTETKDISVDTLLRDRNVMELDETQKPIHDSLNHTIPNKPIDSIDENVSTTPKSRSKSSSKKSDRKKSRIESQLAIDMVEGNPFLNVSQRRKQTPTTRRSLKEDGTKKSRKNLSKTLKDNKLASKPSKNKTVDAQDSEISSNVTFDCSAHVLESQDIIESSQETTISVTSNKVSNKVPFVALENILIEQQNSLHKNLSETISNTINDSELPRNNTQAENLNKSNNNEVRNNHENTIEFTQCTAEADTQTQNIDHMEVINLENVTNITDNIIGNLTYDNEPIIPIETENDTVTMTESLLADKDLDLPLKDEEQREKDFLNNTQEISPIKNLSPLRGNESPPPDSSNDYMVIKLSSPVQVNGEPFDKSESPEVFTEERRNIVEQSPPRGEAVVNDMSPTSLSLKKNRPQVRSNGRGAQMLGLCVSDSQQRDSVEKSPSLNTPVRRNLKMSSEDNETEESENFLKLKRPLPSNDSSPSGPILKRRKLADTGKRVSFHDPPVSTTVCVKKYIKPWGIRSPQNSAIKIQERRSRTQSPMKSPKRLENVFKLDSVLIKAVESFTDNNKSNDTTTADNITLSNDVILIQDNTQTKALDLDDTTPCNDTMDETPIVEAVKPSDLNDTDPICPDLINCQDSISKIASELSSPAMKDLLVKEFQGNVEKIADLARMTELEINRLCIKAPKVQTARKVLKEYLNNINMNKAKFKSTEVQLNIEMKSLATQTDTTGVSSRHIQTDSPLTINCNSQTDSPLTINCNTQTDESLETADFMEKFLHMMKCGKIDKTSETEIAQSLSLDTLTEAYISKLSNNEIMDRIVENLCSKFSNKDLILFCKKLFTEMQDKS